MATIIKREGIKGVSFQVGYRLNGKQKTASFSAKAFTKKDEREAEIEAKKTLDLAKDYTNMKFKDYAELTFKNN